VPACVPLTAEETAAVNVTACPANEGFKLEARVVVVVAGLTTWLTAFELLFPKFASPL